MKLTEMILLGFANLTRTRLRTFLTVLGVVIGIGALTSMVSFGSGMQKRIFDSVAANDLFTSMTVTPKKPASDDFRPEDIAQAVDAIKNESHPLTDSILMQIRNLEGVDIAYPQVEIPIRVKLGEDSATLTASALPSAMHKYKPYDQLLAGTFFQSDSAACVVISEEVLYRRFKIRLTGSDSKLSHTDSLKGVRLASADTLIGKPIRLISMSVNTDLLAASMFQIPGGSPSLPFVESSIDLNICGVLKSGNQFGPNMGNRAGLIIPPATAERIPKLGFTNVWDLLNRKNQPGTYTSIQVRTIDIKHHDLVKKELEAMNVGVFSMSDQLHEIRNAFLIINSILGAIGAIALIVAGLGIINTMIMSIMERTREIGIMKSIGGSEREIRMIFFVEAAVIGVIGAIAGLVLGWVVTRIAGAVMNFQLAKQGVGNVDLFYFPWWLILGAIVFSVLVSLAAGLYPAVRASRIDPVKALRHD